MTDALRPENNKHIRARGARYRTRGITGTQLNGGVISGKEQNTALTGLNKINQYEEMLRTDPIVRRSWHILRQTLLSATWRFTAGIENDVVSEELARYANECFGFDGYSGQMSVSFEEQLAYLLQFIPIGYRYAEEIYKVGPDSNGNVRVWLDHYADREPSAHQKWLSRNGQTLDGVMQNAVGTTYRPEPIPANKLLLLTLNRTGSNFEGVGMLRPCWYNWRLKQRTFNAMGIAADQCVVPIPIVKIDRSQAENQGYTDGDIDTMRDEAVVQVQSLISQEQGYLVENPAVRFETYSTTPDSYANGPISIIEQCNREISAAFGTEFADLGNTDTGARSVGEIHLSVFRRNAINLCDIVAAQISGAGRAGGGTIGRLVRFNYGPIDRSLLPRLTHTGLDTDDLAESMQNLPALVDAGLLTPDDNMERKIRERIGAGDLPSDAQRSPVSRIAGTGGNGAGYALAENLMRARNNG